MSKFYFDMMKFYFDKEAQAELAESNYGDEHG